MKNLLKYIPINVVTGLLFFVFVNLFLIIGFSNLVYSFEKKSLDRRELYVEDQCSILANQILSNGFSHYSMTNVDDDGGGSGVLQLEQMANAFEGRILVVDEHFEILSDTYKRNVGQYIVNADIIKAMQGKEVPYKKIGKNYVRVMTRITDQETEEVLGVLIAVVSITGQNTMKNFLYDQRDTLLGIFFLVSVVSSVLLAFFLKKNFNNIQKQLNIITAGHQEEVLEEEGFLEFYRLSSSMNQIMNRYKELENSRQEFVSNVSHELKTPITSMKILADSLLMQSNVPVELYEEFMNDIVHEIDRENQIITDLLNLVKMDKTQADLNIAPTNINELLEILLKRISPIAKEREITIRLETMRQVVAEVDEVKLSLACNNLIENAVKYNHDGGQVDVSLNADHKFFYIRVKDTGVGIPEECQEQIFERFYRVDKARSRETGGTGLGLAISRNVILMHKGSIRVHSKEGEGTTFTVRIPLNYLG